MDLRSVPGTRRLRENYLFLATFTAFLTLFAVFSGSLFGCIFISSNGEMIAAGATDLASLAFTGAGWLLLLFEASVWLSVG